MKGFIRLLPQRIAYLELVFMAFAIISISAVPVSKNQLVRGTLTDLKSGLSIPYATVSLIRMSDSTVAGGALSDTNGVFSLNVSSRGAYKVNVSLIGYEQVSMVVVLGSSEITDIGKLALVEMPVNIKETVVIGERLKAKSERDKTTFFITRKMLDVSITGIDILKLIPGVQVDLMQKISLHGSNNILIYVDGKERDRSFVGQLNPRQIERVEVFSAPPSNYDGSATGVLNIILKRERDSGLTGQINAEIPASVSEAYIFPTCNFNFGFRKFNFYTSYNGEVINFGVHERTIRTISGKQDPVVLTSDQFVRQRDWSHKFHYGFDYFVGTHDQINFYAFYNPFSYEHNGIAQTERAGTMNSIWYAMKEEKDRNTATFYSLYSKHDFSREGRNITIDLSNYNLNGENRTNFIYQGHQNSQDTIFNRVSPGQNATSIKIDFNSPVGDKLNISAGIKGKFQKMQDKHSADFIYLENIGAAYGTITCKFDKYDLNIGLRAEKSVSTLRNCFSNPVLSFLPHLMLKYTLSTGQFINLSFSRSISRPAIFQLNPIISVSDPYTVSKGNPLLKPEFRTSLFIEHSIQFYSNYFSTRLFYNKSTDAINILTVINDTSVFVTQFNNLGTIHQFGVQFLGSLKLGKATLNPYLRIFEMYTVGNQLAKQYGVKERLSPDFESGLSAIVSLKHDLAVSFVFQYAGKKNTIQGNSFNDALYFLSVEKNFRQKFKVAIVGIVPFTRKFIYQGSDIESSNFSSHYNGIINMAALPIIVKLSYQFSRGKNRNKIERAKEETESLPKKGF